METTPEYSPIKLTPRGAIIATTVASIATVGATFSFDELARSSNEATNRPSHEQILENQQLIETADLLTQPFVVEHGVKVRLSPTVNNGDKSGVSDNIVDDLIPRGERLMVQSAVPVGKGWVAFERPRSKHEQGRPETVEERAANLVYVYTSAVRDESDASDPITLIIVNPAQVVFRTISDTSGVEIGSGYELGNDQSAYRSLESTLVSANS